MKKTLLLSVVASTMIMAGGDIAPVEPVAEAPAVVESGWDFSGQAVVYYQTNDIKEDLFSQESAKADFGLQLRAVNKDVFGGVGFGGEVSGLSTLNLEDWLVDNVMQGVGNGDLDDMTDGGWISQLYMTYTAGNTTFKLGRQELPKALSPFAFSEGWNVFKNTFDAALIVNTDISNTTLVGAWVYGGNRNGIGAGANMSDFNEFNDDNGIFMLTAQNKSFDGVTLTGTWYYAAELAADEDANILWGDAQFALGGVNLGLQAGTWMCDAFADDSVAFGAKAGYDFGTFNASLAYSTVDDGGVPGISMRNVGGPKTPLYTQMILNQNFISYDSDTFVARAGMKALGGKFGLAYDYSDVVEGEYTELDFVYKTKVWNDSTTLFAGYIYQDLNADNDYIDADFDQNVIRFWARYNF
jgi:hypothetical protein